MSDNMERELKYVAQNERVFEDILRDSSIIKYAEDSDVITINMEAVYYDTPNLLLSSKGFSYRIRKEDDSYIATIKGRGNSQEGLHERFEWNRKIDSRTPDISIFKDIPVWPILHEIVGDNQLINVCATRFKRRILNIKLDEETKIELAVDKGEILARGNREPMFELELELISGELDGLIEFGNMIKDKYNLREEAVSKFERGLLLSGLKVQET